MTTTKLNLDLLYLINKYIDCAKYNCDSLKAYYDIGNMPLLTAYRSEKIIPKGGTLPDGTQFTFHGGGCFFEFDGGDIDVDFGPDGRCDGFDLYRLKKFKERTLRISVDEEYLSSGFEALAREGVIYNPSWSPGSNLYYLR